MKRKRSSNLSNIQLLCVCVCVGAVSCIFSCCLLLNLFSLVAKRSTPTEHMQSYPCFHTYGKTHGEGGEQFRIVIPKMNIHKVLKIKAYHYFGVTISILWDRYPVRAFLPLRQLIKYISNSDRQLYTAAPVPSVCGYDVSVYLECLQEKVAVVSRSKPEQ